MKTTTTTTTNSGLVVLREPNNTNKVKSFCVGDDAPTMRVASQVGSKIPTPTYYRIKLQLGWRDDGHVITHRALAFDGKFNKIFEARCAKHSWTMVGPSGHGYRISRHFNEVDFKAQVENWVKLHFTKNCVIAWDN